MLSGSGIELATDGDAILPQAAMVPAKGVQWSSFVRRASPSVTPPSLPEVIGVLVGPSAAVPLSLDAGGRELAAGLIGRVNDKDAAHSEDARFFSWVGSYTKRMVLP